MNKKILSLSILSLLLISIFQIIILLNSIYSFFIINETIPIAVNLTYYVLLIVLFFGYRFFIYLKIKNILNVEKVIDCTSNWVNKKNNSMNTVNFQMKIRLRFNLFKKDIISVACETNNSKSISNNVSLTWLKNKVTISYYYKNITNENNKELYLHDHNGSAKLSIENDEIKDFYYSNNDKDRLSWLGEWKCIS